MEDSVLQTVIWRRKHYESTCRFIAARRDHYKIPINRLIPLAFHTTPALLQSSRNTNLDAIVHAASVQYDSKKSNLFSDWQRYCKTLESRQRALATFEGGIFFAAESIPDSIEREAFISSCNDSLLLLKRLPSLEDDAMRAKMATADKLESYLGSYLCKGIETSILRYQEVHVEGLVGFTDTVRLSPALKTGGDFKMEVRLHTLIGEAISDARKISVEELRPLLGDYLFGGMKTSRCRMEEERKERAECTGAVYVSFPNGEDSKLEVMLGFEIGKDVFTNLYTVVA